MTSAQSVTNLVFAIKNLLEGEFRQVSVIGEVSNLSRSSAGHIYFTLSDNDSGLSAVAFRADALRNPSFKTVKNGDKVLCTGEVSVYTKRGTFQLVVKRMDLAGAGDLQAQFERLKASLAAQGLFATERKRAIPAFAKRVAVITALGAAALQDFLNVYQRRATLGEIVVIPAVVQGDKSAPSLRRALNQAIKLGLQDPERTFDVIVLTRGGGSMEDLWSFNDEGLAWDIFNSPIPVISAVGHQVDFTISDFVADLRCETPTAAAERLTQNQTEVFSRLGRIESQLRYVATHLRTIGPVRLQSLSPKALANLLRNRWLSMASRLRECRLDDRIEQVTGSQEKMLLLDDMAERLERHMEKKLEGIIHRLEGEKKLLDSMNPRQVLGRGYSFVTTAKGHVVGSREDWQSIAGDENVQINFKDGVVDVKKVVSK